MAVPDNNGPPAKGPRPQPINREHISALAKTLSNAAEQLSSGQESAIPIARLQAITAAQELVRSAQPPPEVIMGWFSQAAIISAVQVFQDWKVFDTLPLGEPISYSELAAKLDAEETVLIRIAQMLTSTGVLAQPIPTHITHTPISLALRENEPMGSMFKVMYTNVVATSTILPSYFTSYGRREPNQINHIPTSFLAGEPDLSFFELLGRDADRTRTFMRAMSASTRRVPTVGMYDPSWVIEEAGRDDGERPVWVDVGGGQGHALLLFLRAHAGLPAGRCVVQDLPEVVDEARVVAAKGPDEELRAVKWVPMNFHKDAPVKGAYIYYLRHIMRDYPDSVCSGILANIASSMVPDSRVLISEQVHVNPPPSYAAFKDYTMLAVGGKERTVENWRRVVEAAGLRISGIFPDKGTPQAVIECARADA